jgi:hypothetical protein
MGLGWSWFGSENEHGQKAFPRTAMERGAAQAAYLDVNVGVNKQRLIRGRGDDDTALKKGTFRGEEVSLRFFNGKP